MNPNLNTITAADLPKLKYAIWQQLANDWSPPMSFEDAQEFAARDPELHACAILPSGQYTDPAPFAEIYKRANVPRDLETAAALRQRNIRVQNQRAAAARNPESAPDSNKYFGAAAEYEPAAGNERHTRKKKTATERKQSNLLDLQIHFYSLALILTYGTLYLTAAGAAISGFSSGATALGIAGLILGIITAAIHISLTGYKD